MLTGRAPWRSDLEARGTTLSLRAIPVTAGGDRIAALVLLRDVSELRRRERELLTKDATIREVHHRVKNNLQTVAALLRLQARRLPSRGGPGRAARGHAPGRDDRARARVAVGGARGRVDFDDVLDRTLRSPSRSPRPRRRSGCAARVAFGEMAGENATPLALVFTELVTNAVEHGLAASAAR